MIYSIGSKATEYALNGCGRDAHIRCLVAVGAGVMIQVQAVKPASTYDLLGIRLAASEWQNRQLGTRPAAGQSKGLKGIIARPRSGAASLNTAQAEHTGSIDRQQIFYNGRFEVPTRRANR